MRLLTVAVWPSMQGPELPICATLISEIYQIGRHSYSAPECIALRHAVALTVCGFRCPYPAGWQLPAAAGLLRSARGQSRPVISLTFLMAT
jgi:hypothetical protein